MRGTAARTGAQDFASLLKQSKVLQLTSKQPIALTSHGGYLARGDFGLKRPLPAAAVGKTPFIRLNNSSGIDGSDFVSSARQALFVSRWDESGLTADQDASKTSKRLIEYSPFDKISQHHFMPASSSANPASQQTQQRNLDQLLHDTDSAEQERIFEHVMAQPGRDQPAPFQPPLSPAGQALYEVVRDQDFLTVGAHQMPNIAVMSDKEFDSFISHLESLPPTFKAFLEKRMVQRLEAAPPRPTSQQKRPPSEQLQRESDSDLASSPAPASAPTRRTDLLQEAQQTSTRTSTPDFLDFLTTAPAAAAASSLNRPDYIPPQPHPVQALNYLPFNAFQQQYLQRPLPARFIENNNRPGGGKKRGGKQEERDISVLMGATTATVNANQSENGITQFLSPLDANNQRVAQNRNRSAGFGLARVRAESQIKEGDRPFDDGSNEAHAQSYSFENRLATIRQLQQLAKQTEPQGPAAHLPVVKLEYLNAQEARKYAAETDAAASASSSRGRPASSFAATLGRAEYVRGPTVAEIQRAQETKADDKIEGQLQKLAHGLHADYFGSGKGGSGLQRKGNLQRNRNRWI